MTRGTCFGFPCDRARFSPPYPGGNVSWLMLDQIEELQLASPLSYIMTPLLFEDRGAPCSSSGFRLPYYVAQPGISRGVLTVLGQLSLQFSDFTTAPHSQIIVQSV